MKPSEIIKQKIEEKGGTLKSRQILGVLEYLDEQWEKDNVVSVNEELFNSFYQAYPRKVGKPNAMKVWKKFKVDAELAIKIMASLEAHKKTKQWQDKQYIPHPATWLNQERWNDEVESSNEIPRDTDFDNI